ncbi:MAG: DUF6141 family protein [Planctomycetota bacterium]|jgi:hypothetical protein
MAEQNKITFREVQRFSQWLRVGIAVSMAFAVVLDGFSLYEKLIPARQIMPIVMLTFCGIVLPIAIAILFAMLKMETEVRAEGLYVRFFPLHIRYKKFGPEDVSEYYSRVYRPILEYGGWGIRCGFKGGRAYNVSGNKGVQLILQNGKRLLIGSQKPDELVEAINSMMASP